MGAFGSIGKALGAAGGGLGAAAGAVAKPLAGVAQGSSVAPGKPMAQPVGPGLAAGMAQMGGGLAGKFGKPKTMSGGKGFRGGKR